MPYLRNLGCILATMAVVGCGTVPARAEMDFTSSVVQSGYNDATTDDTPITSPTQPFDFRNFDYQNLKRLACVTITLTVFDGDTGSTPTLDGQNYDYNNWTLGLGGFDTGILLNGFDDNDDLGAGNVTLTFQDTPLNADAILAALQTDGTLRASIIDHTAGPDDPTNFIGIPSTDGNGNPIYTTLTVSDTPGTRNFVPEPGALTWLTGIALFVSGGCLRHRRRQNQAGEG